MATSSATVRRAVDGRWVRSVRFGRVARNGLVMAVVATGLTAFGAGRAAAHDDYTVQSGDSLSIIARDNEVTTEELAAENGISDLHLIRVGQVLRIPHPEPTYYEVKPGDTVSQIAKAMGVSSRALADMNGIDNPNLIRVGQRLEIPQGGAVPEPDPAANYPDLPERLKANPDRLALIPVFEKWSDHYGVPTDLLMAMAYRESGWQSDVVSNKGAIGVGQLLPTTADWLADDLIKVPELDPYDPDDNIRMSARFLQWLTGYMGGESAAVAAYYQGPGSVNARGLFIDTEQYKTNVDELRSRFVRR